MTARFTAARRRAFLRALAATGNQTLAAERAKVSRSWVQLHRSTDPAFRQAVADAVADAKAALAGVASPVPEAAALRWHDGNELVVRGSGGSGGGRRVQIARSRTKQWSPRLEARFLATLASTCNVKAACAEVGLTAAAAYGHRNRWRSFQERWDEALETGYIRLEMALVDKAGNLFSDPDYPLDLPLPDMTTADAIHLLHMHKHQVHGIGKRPGAVGKPPDMDEIRKSILRKIEAIERWHARQVEEGLANGQAKELAKGLGAPARARRGER
jgi:hypothetical protein